MRFLESNNELWNSIVSVKESSFVYINMQSICLTVLRKVIFLSSNKAQWRKKWEVDSIFIPQLQGGLIQFWKLWLNLRSRRWFSPRRSRFISLINFKVLLLKVQKRLAFQMVGSSLFHSIIADGKKVFLKNLRLILISGIPSTFLWSVWPNGWVFVYELSGCGFESRCSHLKFNLLSNWILVLFFL